jgi:hypothetical protein
MIHDSAQLELQNETFGTDYYIFTIFDDLNVNMCNYISLKLVLKDTKY